MVYTPFSSGAIMPQLAKRLHLARCAVSWDHLCSQELLQLPQMIGSIHIINAIEEHRLIQSPRNQRLKRQIGQYF